MLGFGCRSRAGGFAGHFGDVGASYRVDPKERWVNGDLGGELD
jgi:hypothetical protein